MSDKKSALVADVSPRSGPIDGSRPETSLALSQVKPRRVSERLDAVTSVTDAELERRRENARRSSRSDNTRIAYQQAITHYQDAGGKLPATPQDIENYLLRCQDIYAFATLELRLAALARWHQILKLPDPTKAENVSIVFRGIRRQVATQQNKAPPIMASDLLAMITEIRRKSSNGAEKAQAIGLRNEALLLTGFFGMLRVSELTALRRQDITFVSDGLDLYIRASKNDATDKGLYKSIPAAGDTSSLCPVIALKKWIQHHPVSPDNYLFTAIGSPRSLTPHSVNKMLKLLSRTSTTLPEGSYFTSHSLRRGLATQASQLGESRGVIKRQGGWSSDRMVEEYIDEGNRFQNNPALKVYKHLEKSHTAM